MMEDVFKAMIVREIADNRYSIEIGKKNLSELPFGEVLIRVKYSSLNYKDALSAKGNKGVTKKYPHTPGIDAAGFVIQNKSGRFKKGEAVIVTGFDLGMDTPGGFGQYIQVPESWVIPLPEGLSVNTSMIYGTAGFTAALAVHTLMKAGLEPNQGDVLVTGATGGVGSFSVGILSREGFRVVAATGKENVEDYLKMLGAAEVVPRNSVNVITDKALLKGRWAGVIDTVGGNILATAIKAVQPKGMVAVCGNRASPELNINVYPFILRGITVFGIDSAQCLITLRTELWNKIARKWKLDHLNQIASECSLEELPDKIALLMQGKLVGRIFVNLDY